MRFFIATFILSITVDLYGFSTDQMQYREIDGNTTRLYFADCSPDWQEAVKAQTKIADKYFFIVTLL